jgi:hypothetical protein
MKARDVDILTQGLAPVVGEYVAQKIEPILLRVRELEAQCQQLQTRIRLLESKQAVPPSTAKVEAPRTVVRLGSRRTVVRL